MKSDVLPTAPNSPAGPRSSERGSAMIIALMIMIVLTLLGVTFLVLAEQEQQIAVNERDLTQVLYAAEAGVEVAKTWFNNPDLTTNPFKPAMSDLTRNLRVGQDFFSSPDPYGNAQERVDLPDLPGDNVTSPYTGDDGIPFDKEYRGEIAHTFWGRRDTPDVLVCEVGEDIDLDDNGSSDCVSAANGFMANLNAALLSMPSGEHSNRDFGEVAVQQIRVYRPPVDYGLKTRYGVATIEAIAVKKVRGGRIVTRRAVRDVIQEIPFPGPGGAIETESDVGQGGSAGVHWGPVVSAAFNDSDDHITLPGNTTANFPESAVPRDSPSRWGFHHTLNPASGNNLTIKATGGPNGGPLPGEAFTALTELLGITAEGGRQGGDPIKVMDPWLLFRARNRIFYDDGASPLDSGSHPHEYTELLNTIKTGTFDKAQEETWSHMFQRQIVRFPPISYETWKEIVRSGQDGMFYLTYEQNSDPPTWRLNGSGEPQEFSNWVNREVGLGPGVYFFDTADSTAPHDDDEDGVMDNLTPGAKFEKVGANEAYMEGFALVYSEFLSSTGVGNGLPTHVNMPGEIFLDDGLDLHDGSGSGDDCICIRFDDGGCVLGLGPIRWGDGNQICGPKATDCRCTQLVLDDMDPAVAKREAKLFRNSEWDVDLNNDGVPDEAPGPTSAGWAAFIAGPDASGLKGHAFEDGRLPHYEVGDELRAGRDADDLWRDPRFLNHDFGTFIAANDRQPHEPFLNFDYPTNGDTIDNWDNDNGLISDFDSSGDASGCEYEDNGRICQTITSRTTVARDAKGALLELDLNVNGVLYCEGYYTGTGNMKVFGSMMMRGGYSGSASLDVWFNEELVEGDFPPVEWELPRIFTSARDTD